VGGRRRGGGCSASQPATPSPPRTSLLACVAAKRGWRGGDGWLAHLPLALLCGLRLGRRDGPATASLLSAPDAHSLSTSTGLQLQLHVSPRALAVGIGRQCRGAGGASVLSFSPLPTHGYTRTKRPVRRSAGKPKRYLHLVHTYRIHTPEAGTLNVGESQGTNYGTAR
jgi:hypothetical protein